VQLALAGRELGQSLVCLNSPVAAMLAILTALDCVLVSVAVWTALVEPVLVDGKLSEVGEKITAPVPPVPVRLNVCGLLGASSTTLMLAVRVPVARGRNAIEMVQVPPAATVAGASGQLLADW
jgi:hypothetical protein